MEEMSLIRLPSPSWTTLITSGLEDIHYCNLNRFRTRFILGFALFMGLSMNQYFNTYDVFSGQPLPNASSSWFKNLMQVIFSSPPTTATIFASLFDLILPRPSDEEGEEKQEEVKKKEGEPPPKQKKPDQKPVETPPVETPSEVRGTTIPEPQTSLPLLEEEVMERPLAEEMKSFIDGNHSARSVLKKLFSQKHLIHLASEGVSGDLDLSNK
ncbi:hypothetical protein MANES_10G084401v8 [Manihot esculenta]|uniref:Uncharacterized protein n=1 Tax=Manihot esculenta TaxID=3983 RepID=A0ACB7H438_MANES|nr:hypothetical protein MANES_10G084401v8 [Manihot esculenta]